MEIEKQIRLIDTHCHLASDQLKEHASEIIERAQQAGVSRIINIAYDPQSVDLVIEQLSLSPMLYAAVGIQPHDAKTFSFAAADLIRSKAETNRRVVAIGEIGLDAHYTLSPMDQQQACFDYFLQMALELDLPVVVHVRQTHEEVLSKIAHFSKLGLRGVIHCFTGTLSEAKDFLDHGFYISLSGIVTFKNAKQLQEVAQFVPNDRLLIETDSPYLSPVPLRGKVNEPSHLLHTCDFIAQLRKTTSSELTAMTFQNATQLFSRMKM